MYANQIGYSDITPFEVVRVVSDKCLEVRSMNYTHINPKELVFHAGGFVAHCSNQADQEWDITSDANGYVFKIRKNKVGTWKSKHGDVYSVADQPWRRYDFNF
jgi:hypothetical protein